MNGVPPHIRRFLNDTGWAGAKVVALEGDASFRRYFKVIAAARSAILMDAPPPHEDVRPFLNVAGWLRDHAIRAPAIYNADNEQGLVLLEDFGERRMREFVDAHAEDEAAIYGAAINTLVHLHSRPPANLQLYSEAEYLREARLFTGWYCPAQGCEVDVVSFEAAWCEVLAPVIAAQQLGVTVLRDYHAENIMLLDDGCQGLLDFQDALVGHPAYDLVSLLQDARRDVSTELEAQMLARYCAAARPSVDFAAHYAVLGAQRNAKIIGIFVRLWQRDGKPRYLALIPRVWRAMERDLAHPALAPVSDWFDANIPAVLRVTSGDFAP